MAFLFRNIVRFLSYSGRFPQVGAKHLPANYVSLPCSLLKPRPGTNPPLKTAYNASKTPANTPNCAYITQFLPENTN